MRLWLCTVLAVLSLAALGSAQPGAVGGPVSGYVFDAPSRVLRPIVGIPGSATIGSPVNFGFDIRRVYVSPRQDGAIVVAADGSTHFFRLSSGTATERSATGISVNPATLVFSPSGTAAALITPGSAQFVTGLPDAPAGGATINLETGSAIHRRTGRGGPDTGPTRRRAFAAVSDDGAYLLESVGSGVLVLGADGSNWKLMDAGGAAVAFAPGSHDAAVADARGLGLVLFNDLANQTVVASSIPPAVGLRFSADGSTLYLADTDSITAFDRVTGAQHALPCSCRISAFAPMGSTLRLNEIGSGPLWLFDPGTARIVFVPALVATK